MATWPVVTLSNFLAGGPERLMFTAMDPAELALALRSRIASEGIRANMVSASDILGALIKSDRCRYQLRQ
jgi:hypothetical protein